MNNINKFYNGWPTSGEYKQCLDKIKVLLTNYLGTFNEQNSFGIINNSPKKYTVIFDIDDTLVFTDPTKLFNDVKKLIPHDPNYLILPQIKQIVDIAKLCHDYNFKIIIITARPLETQPSSIKNLELFGIKYDEIYHNPPFINSSKFKINLKKLLSKHNNIILSIGDAWHDIQGLNKCLCFKLPQPNDTNSYFTFNSTDYYKIL